MLHEQGVLKASFLSGRLNALLQELLVRVNRRKGGGRGDLGAAVLTSSAQIVAFQGDEVEHLVGIQEGTRAVVRKEGLFEENNLVITNDPFHGGTDLGSFLGLMPLYSAGQPGAFLTLRLRALDTGGAHPGFAEPTATQIYSEGQRVTPIVLARDKQVFGDVWRCLLSNNRMPHRLDADLGALWQGLTWGCAELAAILRSETSGTNSAESLQRLVRIKKDNAALRLEGEGIGQGGSSVSIGNACFTVRVEVQFVPHGKVRVAFTGSSPQLPAPFNSPLVRTAATTLKTLASYWDLTSTEDLVGLLNLIDLDAPPASIVRPDFPAACSCSQPFTTFAIERALQDALFQIAGDKRKPVSPPPFYMLVRKELTPLCPYEVHAEFGKAAFHTYYRGDEWLEFTSETWARSLEETEWKFPLRWLSAESSDGGLSMALDATAAVECSYAASGAYRIAASADGEPKTSVRLKPWLPGNRLTFRVSEQGKVVNGN